MYTTASWQGSLFALQPFCEEDRMQEAVGELIAYFSQVGRPFSMYGMEKEWADLLTAYPEGNFQIASDRDNYDYVYKAEDLINLSGRRYHSKKNHLNSFRKNYPEAVYLSITDDIVIQCKLNINGWYKQRSVDLPDDPFLAAEREAIIEVLNNFAAFRLKGGAIMLGKRVVAFSFGEQLNKDTAVIHVEKADPEIRGAYPAINQAFVEHEWSDMEFINREEDMGMPGLRQAKETYHPCRMIEKFNAKMAD